MTKKPDKRRSLNDAYQDALLQHLEEAVRRIGVLEAEVQRLSPGKRQPLNSSGLNLNSLENFNTPMDRLDRLEAIVKAHNKELVAANARIAGMRIDRQLFTLPKYALRRFKPKKSGDPKPEAVVLPTPTPSSVQPKKETPFDVVVMCPVYPGGSRSYGGEFIQKRVTAYRDAGLKTQVLEINPKRTDESTGTVDGVEVLRCGLDRAMSFIESQEINNLAVHQLERPLWDVISHFVDKIQISVWVHGFEARHWRELEFNYSAEELESLESILEKVTIERQNTMREVLGDPRVRKVFVSDFMRGVAEAFAEQTAENSCVIHNSIVESDFPYVEKDPGLRHNVLWVRSFAARNYSNDLSRDAILELSKHECFERMKFTIYGDGKFFEEATDPLKDFENVEINREFVSTEKLRSLHAKHGIMLVPSRWDSQGLTCGEAMASGLVPVTSRVAALPEFLDDDCGYLCEPNTGRSLAEAIIECVSEPMEFQAKSEAASRRSHQQCGFENTLAREIEFLK